MPLESVKLQTGLPVVELTSQTRTDPAVVHAAIFLSDDIFISFIASFALRD